MRSLILAVVALIALAACRPHSTTLAVANALRLVRADQPRVLNVIPVATGFENPRTVAVSYNYGRETVFLIAADGYPGGTAGIYAVTRGHVRQIVTVPDLGGGRPLAAVGLGADNFCDWGHCRFSVTTDKGSVYEIYTTY